MRRILTKLAVLVLFLIYGMPDVYSAEGHIKGNVEYIRVHDSETYAQWTPPTFWFSLVGASVAGNCKRWSGRILFAGTSEQQLSILLSSQYANREVSLSWNDSELLNGYCKARYLTTGNPPPMN